MMKQLKNLKNKKIALVLSGGVVKAASWHLGVALALEELGFSLKNNHSSPSDLEISTYVGSSAGSIINLYLASGHSPSEVMASFLNKKKSNLKPLGYSDMLSFRTPFKKPPKSSFYNPLDTFPFFLKKFLNPVMSLSGIFTTRGIYEYVKNHVAISENFADYAADVFVVATQLDHSRKVIFSKYDYPSPVHDSTACYYTGFNISDSVAASTAVPPLYSPYPVLNPVNQQTEYYIDGEIRETLSTHVALDNQCDYIISSWTHTPYHYHNEVGSLVNYGLPAICMQAIYLMIQKKIVSSRAKIATSKDIINSVNDYMHTHKFNETHRKNILSILEKKLNYKPNVKLIDIYPTHENYKIFFKNSFSLHKDGTSEAVNMGYKRTLEVFRRAEWEN